MYDGDQVSVRGVFTQEANLECANFIYSKRNLVTIAGGGIRNTTREALQAIFNLTKTYY